MKSILLNIIKTYQLLVSPVLRQVLGIHCRYEKTCSEYAKEAIETNGILKGLVMAIKRLLSCQPLNQRYEYI